MKSICAIAFAVLAVACGGASDSHNSSQSGSSARSGAATTDRQQPVTLTGCLLNADKPDAGIKGTSGSASAAKKEGRDQIAAGRGSIGERFVLTEASGTATASGATAHSYVLDGNVEALRGNLNQRVRVTGTLDRGTYSPGESQRVRVDSVEAAGGTCARD